MGTLCCLINHRNIHDSILPWFFQMVNNFLSTILSFVLPEIIGPIYEETLDRGYFMNTFFLSQVLFRCHLIRCLSLDSVIYFYLHRPNQFIILWSDWSLFLLVYRYTSNIRLTILCHSFSTFSIMQNLYSFYLLVMYLLPLR